MCCLMRGALYPYTTPPSTSTNCRLINFRCRFACFSLSLSLPLPFSCYSSPVFPLGLVQPILLSLLWPLIWFTADYYQLFIHFHVTAFFLLILFLSRVSSISFLFHFIFYFLFIFSFFSFALWANCFWLRLSFWFSFSCSFLSPLSLSLSLYPAFLVLF